MTINNWRSRKPRLMLQLDKNLTNFDLPNKKPHNWTDTIKCLFLVCTWISDFVGTILKKFYHFRILTVYWHLVKTIFIAQFCFSFQTELSDIVTSTIYTRLARNFGIWNENNKYRVLLMRMMCIILSTKQTKFKNV